MNIVKMDEALMVPLAYLARLNGESKTLEYNRNLDFATVYQYLEKQMKDDPSKFGYWNGLFTYVALVPLGTNSHKQGKPCEVHLRVKVEANDLVVGLGDSLLDISMKTWNQLENDAISYEEFREFQEQNWEVLVETAALEEAA
jgi:hypothetical protein